MVLGCLFILHPSTHRSRGEQHIGLPGEIRRWTHHMASDFGSCFHSLFIHSIFPLFFS